VALGTLTTLERAGENPFTIAALQKELCIGAFTCLQILIDVHAQAPYLVDIPDDLGPGVKLDASMDRTQVEKLVEKVNRNFQFRAHAGSVSIVEAGHLICEVRQWTVQHMTAKQVRSFILQLST